MRKFLIVLLSFSLIGFLYSKFSETSKTTENYFFCDAETIDGDNFIGEKGVFSEAKTQSSEKAYSGQFSSKVNYENQYGMGIVLKDLKIGDIYKVSIKYYGNVNNIYLACNGNPESKFALKTNKSIKDFKNGWRLVEMVFRVPNKDNLTYLKVFPFNSSKEETVYYDDLTIEKLHVNLESGVVSPTDYLSVYLDPNALNKLAKIRNKAINLGLLITKEDSWVKGKLTVNTEEAQDIKLRLKGDWTDHLKNNNWSFRVKMLKDNAWNGMVEFSLQNPNSRHYLKEWLFHKLLEHEDVLTTKYDFINLNLNDKLSKVYAYEEHFLKQIPESNNRKEGVIVRFNEDRIWQRLAESKEAGFKDASFLNEQRFFSKIEAFKEKKIFKDSTLLEQYKKANELLFQFQNALTPVDQIFDLDKLAKYFVVCDILEAHHSTVWHNQRFYYNPVLRKLEPIGFDGYMESGELNLPKGAPFRGSFMNNKGGEDQWVDYYYLLFSDPIFSYAYASNLQRMTKQIYLDNFLLKIDEHLKQREELIKKEKPTYRLDIERIYEKSSKIKLELIARNNESIKAYTQYCSEDSCEIYLTNSFRLPIRIIGSGAKREVVISKKSNYDGFVLSSKPLFGQISKTMNIPVSHDSLFWQIVGIDKIYATKIKPFNAPGSINITNLESKKLLIPLEKENYTVESNTVRILNGIYDFNSPMIIPSDYELVIEAGVEINLKSNAYVLSYGRIKLKGTAENPIHIKSEENNQGFVVIQPPQKCYLNYVVFDGLSNLTENEWQLPGAITMYEADVEMNHVTVRNNHCEDALNLVRSKFEINKLHINHTFADGFDADFCQGTIRNSMVLKTGNDGLDFSGGFINVIDCTLKLIGDKGLSGGEQSTVSVENLIIEQAVIGIASKDKSRINVTKLNLSNCNKGLSAYQKKPEYGGGFLKVSKLSLNNVKHISLADGKSEILIVTDEK